MPKRVTNHSAEERDPEIFITLIKAPASEKILIQYEEGGLARSIQMEDPKQQRPVAELYSNMSLLASHVRKQAELPDQTNEDVRCTGIRITYDGPQRKPSAQFVGWRQLHMSKGGFAFALPYKSLGSNVTSQTDGDPEYPAETPLERGEAATEEELNDEQERLAKQEAEFDKDSGPAMQDGSNRVVHSRHAVDLINRQIELAKAYIGGQRAEIEITEVPEATEQPTETTDTIDVPMPEGSQVEYELEPTEEAVAA